MKSTEVKDIDQQTAVNVAEPDGQLDAIREILLQQDRGRIRQLEQEVEDGRRSAAARLEELEEQITARLAELELLQSEVARLQEEVAAGSDDLMPKLIPQMSGIISSTIRDSREELAEALGPIMGDAIRVKIRDSRSEMVDTLYPIILGTVQRAISEFAREFQRNVDARLKATFGPQGLLRSTLARLRGVSPSEMAFRNAFPFAIEELFLIQHESGLLLSQSGLGDAQTGDSDLISGLLTAIRDFARDSFGDGQTTQELDEIQYGDHRIIIQSGQYAYLAAVIRGVEPEWFRARVRKFISELHIQHGPALRDYNGNPQSLPPELQPMIATCAGDLANAPGDAVRPSLHIRRRTIAVVSLLSVMLLILVCFYLQFTIALLPVAFGGAAETPAAVQATVPAVVVVVTATPEPEPTVAPSPTIRPSRTTAPTVLPTEETTAVPTAVPTDIPTQPPTRIPTRQPTVSSSQTADPPAMTNSPVWVRDEPGLSNPVTVAIPRNTAVMVLAQFGEWAQIEWSDGSETQLGWLPLKWLTLNGPIPEGHITPTPEGP